MGDIELPDATTMGEFNLHMRFLRSEVHKLVVAMPHMATKADIAELSRKFDGYATHDDMRAFKTDVEHRLQSLEGGTVGGTVKKWAEWAKYLSAICAAIGVTAVAIVHLAGKLA